VTAYDAIADWYDAWVGSLPLDDDPYLRALRRRLKLSTLSTLSILSTS